MGPPGGLAQLFYQHRGELLRFLSARCGDASEAEDCLQDLWLKTESDRGAPIANGRAYLFRMADNLLADRRRTRQRAMRRDRRWIEAEGALDAPELQADPEPAADDQLASRQEAEILVQAIAELPPGARRALQLHRFEGHGQAEVAEIMGISRSGVEKHLALAMRHLRKSLSDCGYFTAVTSQQQGHQHAGGPRSDDTP